MLTKSRYLTLEGMGGGGGGRGEGGKGGKGGREGRGEGVNYIFGFKFFFLDRLPKALAQLFFVC